MSTSEKLVLDVYAAPYIPLKLKQVNEAPAYDIASKPPPWIDFVSYVRAFAGTFLDARPPPSMPSDLSAPPALLEEKCYKQFFDAALRLETDALRRDRESHHLYQVPLSQTPYDIEHSMHRLVVPGLRESSLPIEVGDVVQLRQLRYDGYGSIVLASDSVPHPRAFHPTSSHEICHSAIVWVVDRFNETLHLRVDNFVPNSRLFNVCFTAQTSRLGALYTALADASKQVEQPQSWLQGMLFPRPEHGKQQTVLKDAQHGLNLFDPHLNREQARAVDTILQNEYGTVPYLISGPPGTGKTKTIVELTMQMLQRDELSHILLCAPSESAADTLVKRLSAHLSPKELLRLNSPARSFPEVPNTILPFCFVDDRIFSLPPFGELMSKQVLVTTTRDTELLRRARLTNSDLFRHELAIFSAYHPRSPSPKFRLHWDAVVMDEAAQATEPEALLPLLVLAPPFLRQYITREPQIVLVGDQSQLGPRTASKGVLQKSLFERLLAQPLYSEHPLARAKERGGHIPRLTSDMLPLIRPPFTDLIRNYRSHPAILAIPSALFYHDTLEPVAEQTDALLDWSGFGGRDMPIVFHDNRGSDEIERDGGGWFNMEEATQAVDYTQSFLKLGVQPHEICVMSPFRAQVKLLRSKARARGFAMAGVNVGPLEAFQGLEFRVVILCTTRTRNRFIDQDIARGLGVIYEPKRFNVALTRAKQAMIIIGNPDVLDQDPNWAAYLAFLKRNDAWKSDAQYIWQAPYGEAIRHSRLEKQLRARQALGDTIIGMRRLGIFNDVDTAVYQAGIEAEDMVAEHGYEDNEVSSPDSKTQSYATTQLVGE